MALGNPTVRLGRPHPTVFQGVGVATRRVPQVASFYLRILFFLPKSRAADKGSGWFTSLKGSGGSPASRALLDPFERETERALSHPE